MLTRVMPNTSFIGLPFPSRRTENMDLASAKKPISKKVLDTFIARKSERSRYPMSRKEIERQVFAITIVLACRQSVMFLLYKM